MKVIILSLVSIYAIACSNQAENQTESVVNPITETTEISSENKSTQLIEDLEAAAFNEKINSGQGILIDVRTADEYAQGHINGAVNLDFNSGQFATAIDTMNREVPVYVYCQAGGRSGKAANLLEEKGFQNVSNLIGGYGNWPY